MFPAVKEGISRPVPSRAALDGGLPPNLPFATPVASNTISDRTMRTGNNVASYRCRRCRLLAWEREGEGRAFENCPARGGASGWLAAFVILFAILAFGHVKLGPALIMGRAHAEEIAPTPKMMADAEQANKFQHPDEDAQSFEYHFRNLGGHILWCARVSGGNGGFCMKLPPGYVATTDRPLPSIAKPPTRKTIRRRTPFMGNCMTWTTGPLADACRASPLKWS